MRISYTYHESQMARLPADPEQQAQIGIIGAGGNAGKAILQAFLNAGIDASQVVASTRTPSKLTKWAVQGVFSVTEPPQTKQPQARMSANRAKIGRQLHQI